MIALAMLFCIFAFIVGLIIKAVEVAGQAGSDIYHKSSDFARYVKDTWKDASDAS